MINKEYIDYLKGDKTKVLPKPNYKYKISELIEYLDHIYALVEGECLENELDESKLDEIEIKLIKHDELMNFDISEELDRELKNRLEECNDNY